MTNNSLTPQQIVDKNGVVTTRNVNLNKGAAGVETRVAKVSAPPATKKERKPLVQIAMNSSALTLGHWTSTGDNYDFNSPYQRGSVWEPERKRNLIRSLMLGIPTGSIVVNRRPFSEDGFYAAIVDGKQRIEAVLDFLNSNLAVPSEWFYEEDLTNDSEMVLFKDLSTSFQRGFQFTTVLPVMEAQVDTIAEEAEIFLLINEGGVDQNSETLQNARKISQS